MIKVAENTIHYFCNLHQRETGAGAVSWSSYKTLGPITRGQMSKNQLISKLSMFFPEWNISLNTDSALAEGH